MSQVIEGTRNLRWVRCLSCRPWWPSEGLVVVAGVEGEFAQDPAGCLADDPDVQVLGEYEDLGSGVGAAGACRRGGG